MKKILTFFCFALLLASCSKNKNISDAIPANASLVTHFNVPSLIEKAHYNPLDSAMLKGLILAGMSQLNKESQAIVNDFMKNVNTCGLNLKGEGFLYLQGDAVGYVLGVNDKAKIENIIKSFKLPVDSMLETNGICSFNVNGATVAFNDSKFIFIYSPARSDYLPSYLRSPNFRDLAIAQLTQTAANSISSNNVFKEMMANKKDISIALMNNKQFKKFGMDGLQTLSYISFEKGKIVATSNYLYRDKASEQKFKEMYGKTFRPIEGKQLEYIVKNPMLVGAVNFNGSEFYSYFKHLQSENSYRGLDSTEMDQLKPILKNIDGDMTLSFSYSKKMLEASAVIKDAGVFEHLLDSVIVNQSDYSNQSLIKISPTSYVYNTDDSFGHLGINLEKNLVRISTLDSVQGGNTEFDKAKGDLALFHFSTDGLQLDNSQESTLIYSMIEGADFRMDKSNYSSTFTIEFKDKNNNSLAVLCGLIDKNKNGLFQGMGF